MSDTERLARIEVKLDTLLATQSRHDAELKTLKEIAANLGLIVMGDGTKDRPGLIGRTATLEQEQPNPDRRISYVSLAVSVFTAGIMWWQGHK